MMSLFKPLASEFAALKDTVVVISGMLITTALSDLVHS